MGLGGLPCPSALCVAIPLETNSMFIIRPPWAKAAAGTIKTVMPIELPEQLFCSSPQNCADTSTLAQGSIFFIDGSSDVISPSTQPAFATGLQSIAAYYSAVPAGIMKVKGTLIGPTHCDVQG